MFLASYFFFSEAIITYKYVCPTLCKHKKYCSLNIMSENVTDWNVFNLCYNPPGSFAIIILNTSLSKNDYHKHVTKLWRKASVRLCVDGGTNEFYSFIHQNPKKQKEEKGKIVDNDLRLNAKSQKQEDIENDSQPQHDIPLPDIISGDFDSIAPDILQYYSELGVHITPTPNQDETDFTKALCVLGDYLMKNDIKINNILVTASVSGVRFDHVMANVNTLFKMNKILTTPVIMMTDRTLLWLLSCGSHSIDVPENLLRDKEISWCGYMSFSDPVVVSTSGLKWDIHKREVAFGQLISTSNTYDPNSKGKVLIDCSGPLLWIMGWDPTLMD